MGEVAMDTRFDVARDIFFHLDGKGYAEAADEVLDILAEYAADGSLLQIRLAAGYLFAANRCQDALSLCQGAVARHPDDALAWACLAEIQYACDELAQAQISLAESVRLLPPRASEYIFVARRAHNMGNLELARCLILSARELDPSCDLDDDLVRIALSQP